MSNETRREGRAGQSALGGRRGLMLVLSSPSGAGKTTLTRALLAAEGESCALSISATTRSPRPGEIDGQHYVFLDRGAFEAKLSNGDFIEWAEVFGNLYGTPKAAIEERLQNGQDVLFDIDWQGARQLADSAPSDVVRLFILPPSRRALESRLKERAADPDGVVAQRLAGASEELSHWREYDYVVVNDDFDETFHILRTILSAERRKRIRLPGLKSFVSGLMRDT